MNSRIITTLSGIGSAWQEGRQRAHTRSELARLTDRQLADIGVRRSDIAAVAARGRHF